MATRFYKTCASRLLHEVDRRRFDATYEYRLPCIRPEALAYTYWSMSIFASQFPDVKFQPRPYDDDSITIISRMVAILQEKANIHDRLSDYPMVVTNPFTNSFELSNRVSNTPRLFCRVSRSLAEFYMNETRVRSLPMSYSFIERAPSSQSSTESYAMAQFSPALTTGIEHTHIEQLQSKIDTLVTQLHNSVFIMRSTPEAISDLMFLQQEISIHEAQLFMKKQVYDYYCKCALMFIKTLKDFALHVVSHQTASPQTPVPADKRDRTSEDVEVEAKRLKS